MFLALAVFMNQVVDQAADHVRSFLHRDGGQDGFEYMLIIGGVSVAVVIAVAVLANDVPGLRSATCKAINGIAGYSGFSCT